MSNQGYVGAAGDLTHAFTVLPHIERAVDTFAQRASLFGGLGMGYENSEQQMAVKEIGGKVVDIGNSAAIWKKEIDVGDEYRFTLQADFEGLPTHGGEPVKEGEYPLFYHSDVRLNVFDSPAYPFWAEMDIQRFANMIANMEGNYQKNIAQYMGKWNDFSGFQACFCGADRGSLLTTDGGLGMQLLNAAAAGDIISCKNTYVQNDGMVTWNADRATYEAAVATALDTLTDTTLDYFSLDAHETILNQIISELNWKMVEFMGKQLRAIAITDPWLIRRLMRRNTSNSWFTLMRDADIRGVEKNHAINRDQAVIIDKILYIPADWIRAWRAYTSGALPYYGAGITTDPQVKIKTANTDSKLCPIVYMGPGALLHAFSRKTYGMGTKSKKGGRIHFHSDAGKFDKGGAWCARSKFGFTRNEMETKIGGTTEYLNNKMLIAWFYDAGPGIAPAA